MNPTTFYILSCEIRLSKNYSIFQKFQELTDKNFQYRAFKCLKHTNRQLQLKLNCQSESTRTTQQASRLETSISMLLTYECVPVCHFQSASILWSSKSSPYFSLPVKSYKTLPMIIKDIRF